MRVRATVKKKKTSKKNVEKTKLKKKLQMNRFIITCVPVADGRLADACMKRSTQFGDHFQRSVLWRPFDHQQPCFLRVCVALCRTVAIGRAGPRR